MTAAGQPRQLPRRGRSAAAAAATRRVSRGRRPACWLTGPSIHLPHFFHHVGPTYWPPLGHRRARLRDWAREENAPERQRVGGSSARLPGVLYGPLDWRTSWLACRTDPYARLCEEGLNYSLRFREEIFIAKDSYEYTINYLHQENTFAIMGTRSAWRPVSARWFVAVAPG